MAKITIDGKELEVDSKLSVIQAAQQHGIKIPHFCWHPKLSVAGNCRMCLVEIEKMPKLAIACATQVADGMVVHTKNERVVKARNAVMEFLLINHPLDCPICDEAGDCKLQKYAYQYSTGYSRFEEDKVHKPKRTELGPHVILDDERCIMCSRCIRYANEIAHQPVLTFTERGTHVVLRTFPDTQFDNPYSMNVIELCPVGALTSSDFRFKSRVWEMSSTESICIGCARGCNTNLWVRNNEILRITPRKNESVNSYWMCDHGRLDTFKFVSGEQRIHSPMVRRMGQLVEAGWDEAIARVLSELRAYRKHEIAALGSAYATNEDNYVFYKFMKDVIGVKNIGFVAHHDETQCDDFLIHQDKTPNAFGAKAIGLTQQSTDEIIDSIKKGTIKVLYVLEDNILADQKLIQILSNIELLIVHSSVKNETTKRADIVLACSTYAEKHGTMTNFQGRVQRIRPAVATMDQDRALNNFEMSRWDTFASHNDSWGKGQKRDARSTVRIIAAIASAMGVKWKYTSMEEAFKDLSEHIDAFKGMTYNKIGDQGMMLNHLAPSEKQLVREPV